jgi:hypothetical protein
LYLYLHRTPEVQIFTVGTPASPGADSSAGPQPIAPGVYDSTGALTLEVGDVADSNGISFGVIGLTAPFTASDPATKPAQGEFMLVTVEVHNTLDSGGQPLSISSAGNFELQDGSGQTYSPVIIPGAAKPPDGSISPGASLNGTLGYDVPSGQTFTLLFKNDQIFNGQILVDLGKH